MSEVDPVRRDDSSWPKGAIPVSAIVVLAAFGGGLLIVSKSDHPVLMIVCVLLGALAGASMLVFGFLKWFAGEPFPAFLGVVSLVIALVVLIIAGITGISGAGGALMSGLIGGMMAANIWAVSTARGNRQR